jgi:dihydroorotase
VLHGQHLRQSASPPSGAILEGFEIVAKHGYRVALHAENASIMARRQKKLMAAGRCDPLAHLDARPRSAVEAVARAAILAEWTGARIHILHVSRATNCAPCAKPSCAGGYHRRNLPALPAVDEHACRQEVADPRQSAGARKGAPGPVAAGAWPTAST